jgi:feruloyl-CoA synthase
MSKPAPKQDWQSAPMRKLRLGPRDFTLDRKPDGTIYVRSPHTMPPYPVKITERLEHWAKTTPEQVFLGERAADGSWRTITYGEFLPKIRAIGEALLARGLSAERPLAVLSGNDIDHALIAYAALYIGVPHAPISPAYSLVSDDFGKLQHIFKLLTPGLVFAADGKPFERAIKQIVPPDVEVICVRNPVPSHKCTMLSELLEAQPSKAVDAANAKITPDTITKFLFTSGSTGRPKGVINTQRMWCSNQAMIRTSLAFLQDAPPVTLDWAPWHHTAGGNHDLGLILFNGGAFYIDAGKPLPGAVEITVKNLKEISPTWYFNVPKGYETLLPYLRNDKQLRENFFGNMLCLWFAGAALAQHVFEEVQELAVQTVGERIPFLTGFGATESGPFAMARIWETNDSTNMGLPGVGCDLKLVPMEGKLDARLKGPNITPGYWREPELTRKAFDDEGFYRLGDALKFQDENDPGKGLLFDGRTAEDFKLSSGTWVNVGPLKSQIVDHFAPYVRDVVLAGIDRGYLSALIFPNIEDCRKLCGVAADASPAQILTHDKVQAKFAELLTKLAKKATGGSNRLERIHLLEVPPSMDAGEMTDKGSINQRAVLAQRAALVEELYADQPTVKVIRAEEL